MKFSYPREQILAGMTLVAGICSGRTTKQILQCAKLIAREDGFQIQGTDLEVALRCKLPGEGIREPGEAVVPAARFLSILKEMRSEVVEVEVEGQVVSIRSTDGRFKLLGDDPLEFPEIPQFDDEGFVSIDGAMLNRYAARTVFAAARDMGRYAYNGILLEIREKGIQLVATDGRRLALSGLGAQDNPLIASAIVPVKGLLHFSRDFLDQDESLKLKIDKSQVVMKTSRIELAGRLLEGEFPNYMDVIPKDHNKKISVEREAFLSALRKAAITAGEEARSVRFSFKPGWLKIFSCQEGVGEAEVEIPVEFEGEPFDITFNPDFIVDYLRVVESDKVQIELKDTMSAGLFKTGEDSLYVVMPITARA